MTAGDIRSRLLKVGSVALRLGAGLAVVAVAVGILAALVLTRPEAPRLEEVDEPPVVAVMVAEPVEVARVWEGFGTARAMDAADVAAEVSGRVVERPGRIEAGVRVSGGELLLRLDATDYEQRLAAAGQALASLEAEHEALGIETRRLGEQAELADQEAAIREREYRRAVDALEQGAGNVAEVEARLAAWQRSRREASALRERLELVVPRRSALAARVQGARADVRLAEENLARTRIVAPIDGVLQSINGKPGEFIAAGAGVARVVDLARLEVPLRIPVSALETIRAGDAVRMRPDGPSAEHWDGRIARIAPESDPGTRTATVFVEVVQERWADGPAVAGDGNGPEGGGEGTGALLPGRFVVGSVSTAAARRRIVVPRRAVDGDRVAVVVGREGVDRVEFRNVRVAYHIDGRYEQLDPDERQWSVIESGVEAGDRVIVLGLRGLLWGQPVTPEVVGR